MNKKTMSIGTIIVIAGAFIAYQVGSGFATGQETIQYYTAYGLKGFLVGGINAAMASIVFMAYAYAGRVHQLNDLNSISEFYAGTFGKLFVIFAWIFNACCYLFMISGFGNTLNQQFGMNATLGITIAVILSVGTAILGLKNVVNIIGRIGPVIAVFTLLIGVAAMFKYVPMIPEGLELISSGQVEVTAAGSNWLTAGLSLGGCTGLLTAAFVAKLGVDLRDYKWKYTRIIIIGTLVLLAAISFMMGMLHVGNVRESIQVAIPNLLLAGNMIPGIAIIFAIIILLAVYTTICSIVWACASTFVADEKSMKYKIVCVVIGVIGWVIASQISYSTLVNYIMTYCGYTGVIVFAVIGVRYFMIRKKDKENGITGI